MAKSRPNYQNPNRRLGVKPKKLAWLAKRPASRMTFGVRAVDGGRVGLASR